MPQDRGCRAAERGLLGVPARRPGGGRHGGAQAVPPRRLLLQPVRRGYRSINQVLDRTRIHHVISLIT